MADGITIISGIVGGVIALEPISKPSLLKSDDAACEMNKGQVVGCLSLPPDQQ